MFLTSVGVQKDRIFDIADVPFTQVSDDEKRKYQGKMLETGSYQGYKLRQYWVRHDQRLYASPRVLTMLRAARRWWRT